MSRRHCPKQWENSYLRETNETHATAVTIFKRLKLLSNFPLNLSKDNQNFIEWKIWGRVRICGIQGNHILDKKTGKLWKSYSLLPCSCKYKTYCFSIDFLSFGCRSCHKQAFLFLKSYGHLGLISHKNDGNHEKDTILSYGYELSSTLQLIFKVGRKKTLKVKTTYFLTFIGIFEKFFHQ